MADTIGLGQAASAAFESCLGALVSNRRVFGTSIRINVPTGVGTGEWHGYP